MTRAGGPQWLRNLGVSGYTYSQEGGPTLWAPNMDDPTVKAEFQKLVQALGARFDGLPGFGPIDIGSVGLWGEWHNWADDSSAPSTGTPRDRSAARSRCRRWRPASGMSISSSPTSPRRSSSWGVASQLAR